MLIEKEADMNATDDTGAKSLWYETEAGGKKMVELLLAADADMQGSSNKKSLMLSQKAGGR